MSEINEPTSIFWFRRDLRIEDNVGLYHALKSKYRVLPLFIFDTNILEELPKDDARVSFLYSCLSAINKEFAKYNSSLLVEAGKPLEVFQKLLQQYNIAEVFTNSDYEPYGRSRDEQVTQLLQKVKIPFHRFKDHIIREYNEVLKKDGTPYTVYTPYSKKWFDAYSEEDIKSYQSESLLSRLIQKQPEQIPSLNSLNFTKSEIKIPAFKFNKNVIISYEKNRNTPSVNGASYLGIYLRFGAISVREVIRQVGINQTTFVKQLIWREFFIQILYNFPHVVNSSFKKKYDQILWPNNEELFAKWCDGKTGYPIVDAGMRELNQTGYMHNRVRMITASFLCKHLLIDWRWGEAYFASKLLDYELASNNGNWQWASGTGCDAAPYFRIFNPYTQQQKFDRDFIYINKWVPEYGTIEYPSPIVDHKEAREKALELYKKALR
jgi:deoxyribodipyrimidine photo-lyase